jgi:hypothetical protein
MPVGPQPAAANEFAERTLAAHRFHGEEASRLREGEVEARHLGELGSNASTERVVIDRAG